MWRMFKFHIKLFMKDYFVIMMTIFSILLVILAIFLVKGESKPNGILQGTIGVYTGLPIPLQFGGIKMYTSTKAMVKDIQRFNLPVGVDVKNKVLYTAPIYADISTEALSYMASAAEKLVKGGSIYPYIDDVWWDPYAAQSKFLVYAMILVYLFIADFLIMYISLEYKARASRSEKLWHLLGVNPLQYHGALLVLTFLSAFIVILPLMFVDINLWKVFIWVLYITLVSAGISAYFVKYANNVMVAYLSLIIPIGFMIASLTYVLLPDKLGILRYVPWTYMFVDIFKMSGAEGSIGGLTFHLRILVLLVWALLAAFLWFVGVRENG